MSYDVGEEHLDPGAFRERDAIHAAMDVYAREGWTWVIGEWGHLGRKGRLGAGRKRYRAVAAELRARGWNNCQIGRALGRRPDTILRLLETKP
jgi:hypothetical protein